MSKLESVLNLSTDNLRERRERREQSMSLKELDHVISL